MDGNNPPVYDNGRRLEASEIEGLLKDEDCATEKDYDDGETLPSVEGRSQKNPDRLMEGWRDQRGGEARMTCWPFRSLGQKGQQKSR